MKITIPYGASPGRAGPGLTIPLPFFGAAGAGGDARKVQALRAVTAAAVDKSVAKALAVVKEAKDNPDTVAARVEVDADKARVKKVFSAVATVQRDRSNAGSAGERLTALCRAIGADPALAQAAQKAIDQPEAPAPAGNARSLAECCLDVAAAVDAAMLERATTAARGQRITDYAADELTEIESLKERVGKLEGANAPPAAQLPAPAAGQPQPAQPQPGAQPQP